MGNVMMTGSSVSSSARRLMTTMTLPQSFKNRSALSPRTVAANKGSLPNATPSTSASLK